MGPLIPGNEMTLSLHSLQYNMTLRVLDPENDMNLTLLSQDNDMLVQKI